MTILLIYVKMWSFILTRFCLAVLIRRGVKIFNDFAQVITGSTWECIVLLAAVTEMTNPPAEELSLTRNTPSVLMCGARILFALSRLREGWNQACVRWTVAWVSVNLSATGAATLRLKLYSTLDFWCKDYNRNFYIFAEWQKIVTFKLACC